MGGRNVGRGVEVRQDSLRIVFHYKGVRNREALNIPATKTNIKYADKLQKGDTGGYRTG
ncbi:MAG: DUF3596 domain-containing protein [Magnetococcales bacterium]|nr:DUF3596 domain-containing protein [Magnetococcales bacterium]